MNQLDALPYFQQERAAETYSGLKVFWPATFAGAGEQSGPKHKWVVILAYDHDPRNVIVCKDIDIERDARLKLARKGDAVTVHGTIQRVSGLGGIMLKDFSIDFK